MEWAPHNICVNSLSPGYNPDLHGRAAVREIPQAARGVGKVEYVGKVVEGQGVFVLSEAGGFMTGFDLRVDGGHVAW